MNRRLARSPTIADLRRQARMVLPRMVFDMLEGGAGGEETLEENRDALRRVRLVPRAPVDVTQRNPGTTLFGRPAAFPVVIGPTGLASAFWPDGELALARAAARAGIPFVMSSGAGVSPEALARAADGRRWFQLYMPPDRDVAADWLRRVAAAGFDVLEVTVDGAVPGARPRDARNGFSMPLRWTPGKALQIAARPGWAWRVGRHGAPVAALRYPPDGAAPGRFNTRGESLRHRFDASFDWDGVRWLRDRWQGPLVLKGVTDPGAVGPAVEIGLDGIVVSNHGGRQLDGSVGTATVLPDFAERAGDRLTLLVDGGFRSGTDVLKGLALGASAVQVGRATLYGLAVAGEEGVVHALDLLRQEIDNAMALLGVTTPGEITVGHLRIG